MCPLRPSSLQPEGAISITEVVVGDFIYVSITPGIILVPQMIDLRTQKWAYVAINSSASMPAFAATNARGLVAENNTTTGLLVINVGSRPKQASTNRKGQARVPYDAIRTAMVTRPRYEGVAPDITINARFPRRIPVSFDI